jgi:transglutaminase-like putative cysteine protease
MKYRVCHTTTYDYESPVMHGRHVVRKRPRPMVFQEILQSSLSVSPTPVWTNQSSDYFGNFVDVVEVIEPHDRLVVTATSDINLGPRLIDAGLPLFQSSWESVRDRLLSDPSCYEAREMLLDSPLVRRHPKLLEFAQPTFTPRRPMLEAIQAFNARIYEEFTYDPGFSDIATPLGQVLREKRGVCQDFAHVAVGALRSLGLAARYVSGYLETRPPPGQPRLVGADASHAWASAYVPDYGWVAFDPTNNVLPSERHIVVAWGRDFNEVSPLRGVVHGGGSHTVRVSVDVEPRPEKAKSSQQQQQQQ